MSRSAARQLTRHANRVLWLAGTLPLLALFAAPGTGSAQEAVEAPKVVLSSVPFSLTVHGTGDISTLVEIRDAGGVLLASGPVGAGETREFRGLVIESRDALPLQVRAGDAVSEVAPPYAPGWVSILPPLVAIALALIFKEVITALLAGIWLGALVVAGYNPLQATGRLIDQYVVPALGNTDGGHTQIVVFSLLLGGMVGIISRNGGTMGVVQAVAPLARNRRRGKIATALAGLAIFFDDYANTLVVGNTMRPITDRLKVSREKLAYLVDSTAAPVAALVPVSTWVGYEVSLIEADLPRLPVKPPAPTWASWAAQPVHLLHRDHSLPLLPASRNGLRLSDLRDEPGLRRDGPRGGEGGLRRRDPPAGLAAGDRHLGELRGGQEGVEHRWWNAGIPVLTVVLVVLGGLYASGGPRWVPTRR